MKLSSICALLLIAAAVQESCCVVWGPKKSKGQRTPQVFEVPAEGSLDEEIDESVDEFHTVEHKRVRRQAVEEGIGYGTALDDDNHYLAVVHWTGHPSENIFIVTMDRINGFSQESWLWRSTDYGHSFVNETNKLPSDAIVNWYYISPFSQYLIFSDVTNRRLYLTLDEGETYSNVSVPFAPYDIEFQSSLAPNSDQPPYHNYTLGYDSSAQTLWVSLDMGFTWNKIGNSVPPNRYFWRTLGTDVETSQSDVYYEQRTSSNSSFSMLYKWNSNLQSGQLFSTDLGQIRTNSLVLEQEYIFVEKLDTIDVTNRRSPLWVSYRRNTTFQQAIFPVVTEQQHYSIIDASEGQVFIAVYHVGNSSNLYISEEQGVSYSLTLEDIVSPPESAWLDSYPTIDVHVVEGIVGTYFANRHAASATYGSTVVSFDKGGRWNLLSPPAIDYRGRPIICAAPYCSLHLHMDIDEDTRNYQTVLSQDSAIGLIMAQGNLGSRISNSFLSNRLYFSRDGGFTWAEVQRSRWEFQFAALGSIVVAVRKRALISYVLWSCDEGATWNRTDFTNRNEFPNGIVVIGIRTENGEKSRHVTLFGYDNSRGFQEWLIFDLNFTSVVPNQCDPDRDYYSWVPTDERPGSRCLLGEVVAYERRNASKCCYVDPNYEKGTNRSACPCAIEDFECDFGFERANLNSPCNPYPGHIYPPSPPDDCPEGENYTYSSGYRKIAGDICYRGSEDYFFPITRDCPIEAPQYLVITSDPPFTNAGTRVTFSLRQFSGATHATVYQWSFNDSSSIVNHTGFAQSQHINHTFTLPGVYTVRVTASNSGGSSDTEITFSVYDEVKMVSIIPPSQVYNSTAPAGISLIFTASVSSVHGTNFLDISDYQWHFGDNTTKKTDSPIVEHTYTTAGHYTVMLSVHSSFIESSGDSNLPLMVYEATSSVDIHNSENAIQEHEGRNYVAVNTALSFYTQLQNSEIEIPPNTSHVWHLTRVGPIKSATIPQNNTIFQYTFTSWGFYHLTVTVRASNGAVFIGQRYLTAEFNLTTFTVSFVPITTARINTVVKLNVSVTSNTDYEGPLDLCVLNNGTRLSRLSSPSTTGGTSTVVLGLNEAGALQYELKAANDISHQSVSVPINVAKEGDYANLAIQFSQVPSYLYNDIKWQEMLKDSVKLAIVHLHPTTNKDLIEIEGVRLVPQNGSVEINEKDILKRSAPNIVVFVYVDINILPEQLTPGSIAQAHQLAIMIASEARNKNLTVTVNNQTINIQSASVNTGGIIIEPPVQINRFDAQKYVIIGGALGGLLVMAVVITIVLVVVVYFYRRKYTRLNVRYSRLQQTPVRFTFTPGGEMIEENDDDDDDDSDIEPTKYSESVNI